MRGEGTFKVECHSLEHETHSAILVKVKSTEPYKDRESIWFPLSAVNEIHRDDIAPWIVVDLWIAKKKGLLK